MTHSNTSMPIPASMASTAFAMARIPTLLSQPGARHAVGKALQVHARSGRVIVVADPAMQQHGYLAEITTALQAKGYDAITSVIPAAEPKEHAINDIIALARNDGGNDNDLPVAYVGVGGGSALDIVKIVAASAGVPVAHYEAAKHPFPLRRAALLAIPSTSGTGAEATRTAVYTNAEGDKTWAWDNALLPDSIILDPEITVGLPAGLTAATGLDAFVHAFEAATNRFATEVTSSFCLQAIRLVRDNLAQATRDGNDIAARSALQLAACYAGVGITNAQTAIAHNIGHALGSLVPVHHGRAVAIALGLTMAWSIATAPASFEPATAAFFGTETGGLDDLNSAYRAWMDSVGVPLTLADTGLSTVALPDLVKKMTNPHNTPMLKSNHRMPDDRELNTIAQSVLNLA
ncbi:MAG: iron-containing alcohol dehydrogenase [Alphaproteobacteria bacterium]|nr:iron-containing alcohol dehydrogenase [Alphaproteobacteria bacterium]